MKVTFIHHSCFAIETEEKIVIFDYFDGDRITGFHFDGKLPDLNCNKQIYMFASHKHQDHFDLDILKLAQDHPNIHYILSKDIRLSRNYLMRHGIPISIKKRILFVASDAKYVLDGIEIETLRSTDAGVAFLIKIDTKYIYHAGDLHNWKFEGAGEIINGKMEREFKFQMRKLAGKHIHAAFLVLDPRLNENQYVGLDYFMKQVSADYIFPMHMWQNYSLISDYKKMCDNAAFTERIIDITGENQTFMI